LETDIARSFLEQSGRRPVMLCLSGWPPDTTERLRTMSKITKRTNRVSLHCATSGLSLVYNRLADDLGWSRTTYLPEHAPVTKSGFTLSDVRGAASVHRKLGWRVEAQVVAEEMAVPASVVQHLAAQGHAPGAELSVTDIFASWSALKSDTDIFKSNWTRQLWTGTRRVRRH